MIKDQNFDQVDDTFEGILRTIIAKVHARDGKDSVAMALYFLLVRDANTWRSIRILRKNTPEHLHAVFIVDVGTLLRAMFDANLQADYIFADPAKRIERAKRYLDFEHVERHEMMQKILGHDNQLANTLKSSPRRSEGEKRNQEAYDRVKDQFLIKEKKCDGTAKRATRTRNKWYKGGMPDLAKSAGREAEYDTFVASFSGCVHSSAFAVRNGPIIPVEHVMAIASKFTARLATMNVEYNKLELGDDRMVLEVLGKGWFE